MATARFEDPAGRLAEIDVDATRVFYASFEDLYTSRCGCDGCRNYEQGRAAFPAALRSMLAPLGVDAAKEWEVVAVGPAEDAAYWYAGWFVVVGRLLAPSTLEPDNGARARISETGWFFSNNFPSKPTCDALPDAHCVAIEFVVRMPRLLELFPERAR